MRKQDPLDLSALTLPPSFPGHQTLGLLPLGRLPGGCGPTR
jgi:hypothetical protein